LWWISNYFCAIGFSLQNITLDMVAFLALL
jgi:hypothetical protein